MWGEQGDNGDGGDWQRARSTKVRRASRIRDPSSCHSETCGGDTRGESMRNGEPPPPEYAGNSEREREWRYSVELEEYVG